MPNSDSAAGSSYEFLSAGTLKKNPLLGPRSLLMQNSFTVKLTLLKHMFSLKDGCVILINSVVSTSQRLMVSKSLIVP